MPPACPTRRFEVPDDLPTVLARERTVLARARVSLACSLLAIALAVLAPPWVPPVLVVTAGLVATAGALVAAIALLRRR
jgi:uncharacterized membrane protein YidH (DUF202 family)